MFAGDYKFSQSENKEQMRRVKRIFKHDKYFPFWKEGHVDIPDDFDVGKLTQSGHSFSYHMETNLKGISLVTLTWFPYGSKKEYTLKANGL